MAWFTRKHQDQRPSDQTQVIRLYDQDGQEIRSSTYRIFLFDGVQDPPQVTFCIDNAVYIEEGCDYFKRYQRHTDTEHYFIFFFNTGSALKQPWAFNIISLLHNYMPLYHSLKENMTTALHEAIMNACIHGNCELNSGFNDLEGLNYFYDTLAQRLEHQDYKDRIIILEVGFDPTREIQIAITDQGMNFNKPSGVTKRHHDLGRPPHGLGLDLIAKLTKQSGFIPTQNTFMMSFRP